LLFFGQLDSVPACEKPAMCPLRYLVLLLSAFVAMIVCVWSYYDKEEDEFGAVLLNGHGSSEIEKESEKTRPVDFITGKYLCKQWKKFRSSSSSLASGDAAGGEIIERSA
jgi:hypothetical protein